MATAFLEHDESGFDDEELAGCTPYRLTTSPYDAPPFAGPPGETWAAFSCHGEGGGQFEWRTGVDEVREMARRVVAGELTLDGARRASAAFGEYLDRMDERWGEDDGLDRRPSIDEMVAELASGDINPSKADDLYSFYHFEGDTELREAAEALELPAWVTSDSRDDGGPGSGYTAVFLLVAKPHTLAELEEWLNKREAARSRRKKRR